MSLYVFDTDTLTLLQKGHPRVIQRYVLHAADELAITVMSVEEQLGGWYARIRQARKPDELERRYQELADAVTSLGNWQILSYPQPAIQRYEQLKAMKLNVAKMDLRIAAITLEHNGILVTRNIRDFQRIPGLAIEDWTV